MLVASLTLAVALSTVSLPPPLCRGRTFAAYDPRLDKVPGTRAVAEVQAAYDALCPKHDCGTGQLFENATIGNNAVTWVSGTDHGAETRAKIVYSAGFLDALAGTFGPGASFGVLAHEVGHHLTAALSMRKKMDSSWDEELRADYLAGCALGRSGRPPNELESALRALAAVASKSHPAFNLRNPVVRKGYADCKKAAEAQADDAAFGIGAALRQKGKKAGCWSFWSRDKAEIAKVGPVAAKRRRSRTFEARAECEAARMRLDEVERHASEPCTCD
ncbi:hypothetical protein L6R52_30200 [Myxococcota bacterium]|nr:hypothetical protein [Myxococcota bacterium]